MCVADACRGVQDYPEVVNSERDGLAAKRVLVISETRDYLVRLKESKDVRVIQEALSDTWEGYGEELKEALEALETHKQSLMSSVKEKLAAFESMDDVGELRELLEQTSMFSEGLETERAAVMDKQQKLIDEGRKELVQLAKSEDYLEIQAALSKYEEYGGGTESAWNQLHLHAEELVDSVKLTFIELARSNDAVEITAALEKYEVYNEIAANERESVIERRKTIYFSTSAKMQAFASRSDVTYPMVQEMIAEYAEFPDDVKVGKDALQLKLTQLFASVGDRLSFLVNSTNITEIDQALADSEGLGEEVAADREKLTEHRKKLRDNLAERLVEAHILENPGAMMLLLTEAEHYGEDLATEVKELKRRRDILVATAGNTIKTLLMSEDFRALSDAVQRYESFSPETQADWEQLRVQARKESGNAKSRLQRLASSNDPNLILETIQQYEGADKLLRVELMGARERCESLLDMARVDMKTLARSARPTIMEIEEMLYRYAKYPDGVDDARTLLSKKADEIASDIEQQLQAIAHSESIQEINEALKTYRDAGERFVHTLAALRKSKMLLVEAMSEKMRDVQNAASPVLIDEVLEQALEYEDDLRVEQVALARRKRELIENANDHMSKLLKSLDFPEISEAVERYDNWGEATVHNHRRLKEHWIAQLDSVSISSSRNRNFRTEFDPARACVLSSRR